MTSVYAYVDLPSPHQNTIENDIMRRFLVSDVISICHQQQSISRELSPLCIASCATDAVNVNQTQNYTFPTDFSSSKYPILLIQSCNTAMFIIVCQTELRRAQAGASLTVKEQQKGISLNLERAI